MLSFFGPSFRGRYGPAPYILLLLLFAFYGILAGFGIGALLKSLAPEMALNFLGAIFAGSLSLGLVFSLGTGTTAQPSELDFLMTGPVKPREWLVSDMLFQFIGVLLTGGLAGVGLAIGLTIGLGISLLLGLALLLLFGAYLLFMFMTIQILVILRIRRPKWHIRAITVVILVLSLIPSVSLVSASFPLQFSGLPIPQSGFGQLAYDIISGQLPDVAHLAYAVVWFVVVAAIWFYLSNSYVFYGIKPTLSAGFGQVDFSLRAAQQRRITSALGGLTTRVTLRTDTGSDLGFMTRFHLVRVWRDGSILFVILLVVLFIVPSFFSGGTQAQSAQASQGSMQILTLPIAILALNWSYYERVNLWVVVTSGKSVVNYFRGLMMAFAVLVMVVGGALVLLLQYFTGIGFRVEDFVLPIISPIVASIAATSMLTQVRIKPAAFDAMFLAVLLVTVIAGFGGGFGVQALVAATPGFLGEATKVVEIIIAAIALALLGELLVGRLAKGFRY